VPIKKRVFLTATPRHCNPLQKDDQREAEVLYSMDDEAQYGKVAYSLSCRKAVELGIICDYKVLITVFTTAEVNDWLLRHGRVPIKSANEGGDFVTAWDVANQKFRVQFELFLSRRLFNRPKESRFDAKNPIGGPCRGPTRIYSLGVPERLETCRPN
jgi:hypothetical protein